VASAGVSAVSAAAASWSSIVDKSACVIEAAHTATACAADAPWQQELHTVTQHVQCSFYNAMFEASPKQTATRTCTSTIWGNPDISNCVLKSCAADSTTTTGITYAQTNVHSYAAVDCATYDPTLYASGSVYRHCGLDADNSAEWGAVDVTDCVKIACSNDDFWGNSVASGTTVSKPCASYDVRYEMDSGLITRTCTDGVWGHPNFANCVAVSGHTVCGSSGVLEQTFVGSYTAVSCVTYNSVKYSAGTAYALCSSSGGTNSFGTVDVSGCTTKQCTRSFPWDAVDVDSYSEAWCPDASAAFYKSGVCRNHCVESGGALAFDDWANRIDLTAGPDAPVLADGLVKCAAHTKGFPESIATQIARVSCTNYDAEIYNAGTAYLECLASGSWSGTPNLTGCTKKQCTTTGDWTAVDVLTDGSLDCATHSALYVTGNDVTRTCTNESGIPTWSTTLNVDSCVYKQCEAAGWTSTNHGATQKLLCNTLDSTHYIVDKNYAYRPCFATVFGAIDTDDCVMPPTVSKCVHDPIWPDSFSSATAISINCDQIDAEIYVAGAAGGSATRLCTDGVWATTTDVTACVKKQCVADTTLANASAGTVTWVATNVGETAELQCGTYDSTLYAASDATQLVTRTCRNVGGTPTWDASVTLGTCAVLDCAAFTDADSIVWPTVADGAKSEVQCSDYNVGYSVNAAQKASRTCNDTVMSSTVDVSACTLATGVSQCAAADGFPTSWVSTTAVSLQCSVYNSDYAVDSTKSATRVCGTGGVWTTVDNTACDTKIQCADDTSVSGFAAMDVGAAALTIDCSVHNHLYATGAATQATRTCTNVNGVATWDSVNVSACQWKDCPADGNWPANTADGTNGEIDCSVYNANYATGATTKAKKACVHGVWATAVDVTDCVNATGKFFCPTEGLWTGMWGSATAASLDCTALDAELYSAGSATRICGETDGVWGSVTFSGVRCDKRRPGCGRRSLLHVQCL